MIDLRESCCGRSWHKLVLEHFGKDLARIAIELMAMQRKFTREIFRQVDRHFAQIGATCGLHYVAKGLRRRTRVRVVRARNEGIGVSLRRLA